VEKGCIAAYGIDYTELGKKSAQIIIDIIEGKKPSEIPIVYYRDTKLYINKAAFKRMEFNTAKRLPNILKRTEMLYSALSEFPILAIAAIGFYISLRFIQFPDLTVDASFMLE